MEPDKCSLRKRKRICKPPYSLGSMRFSSGVYCYVFLLKAIDWQQKKDLLFGMIFAGDLSQVLRQKVKTSPDQ